MYTFVSNNGDTSSASVGGNYDLLRPIAIESVLDCVVWKEPVPVTGTMTTSVVAGDFNGVESLLLEKATATNYTNRVGLSLYDIDIGSSVEFDFVTDTNPVANILYLSNTARSENVNIYVNDVLVKNINTNKGYLNGHYITEDFFVPSAQNTSTSYKVKIINNGTKKFSFVGFNFFRLKDYNGQQVDSYKVYRLKKYFISNVGASDYAIRDKDLGKWCGSYHGGEIRESGKITWNSSKFGTARYVLDTDITIIANNTFSLLNSLRITQFTNINNKAKMSSTFDFDIDGTLNMQFGLYENTINATDIYTSLTCTYSDFEKINYPTYKHIIYD